MAKRATNGTDTVGTAPAGFERSEARTEAQRLQMFVQDLKQMLWQSPCAFTLRNPDDEEYARIRRSGSDDEEHRYTRYVEYRGVFEPAYCDEVGVEVGVTEWDGAEFIVEINPFGSFFGVTHQIKVDYAAQLAFAVRVREGISRHFPPAPIHYDDVTRLRWSEPQYPEFDDLIWHGIRLETSLGLPRRHVVTPPFLYLSGAKVGVRAILRSHDEQGDHDLREQARILASKLCDFWLDTWEAGLIQDLGLDVRDLSRMGDVVIVNMFTGEAHRRNAIYPSWMMAPAPSSYRYWSSCGYSQAHADYNKLPKKSAARSEIDAPRIPKPPEDLEPFGPRAGEAFEEGYRRGWRSAIEDRLPDKDALTFVFPYTRQISSESEPPVAVEVGWIDPADFTTRGKKNLPHMSGTRWVLSASHAGRQYGFVYDVFRSGGPAEDTRLLSHQERRERATMSCYVWSEEGYKALPIRRLQGWGRIAANELYHIVDNPQWDAYYAEVSQREAEEQAEG